MYESDSTNIHPDKQHICAGGAGGMWKQPGNNQDMSGWYWIGRGGVGMELQE